MAKCEIPSSEIMQDIADTKAEITQMERQVEGFLLLGDRLSLYRAEARRQGIVQRRAFITQLEEILRVRTEEELGDGK